MRKYLILTCIRIYIYNTKCQTATDVGSGAVFNGPLTKAEHERAWLTLQKFVKYLFLGDKAMDQSEIRI